MKITLKTVHINLPRFFIFFLILTNLFLSTLPLTNTLGYEFSAVNAILLFALGGMAVIYRFNKDVFERFSFYELVVREKYFIASALLIPFFIVFFSSIFFAKCPPANGVLFYLFITVPSFFGGITLGFFSFALSKKFSLWIFFLLFFVLLCVPLIEFYFYPQVYFYNTIIGYFPGTIYDEDLSVDRILIAYRLFNLVFFIGLIYLAVKIKNKKFISKLAISLLLIVTALIFVALKPALHFSTNKHRLKLNLDKTITTENFQIHYTGLLGQKEIEFAALLHEYYLERIKIELKENYRGKIDSYLFESRDQKRKMIGAGSADLAKPWLAQIYLNYTNYDQTLKHELVHSLSANFGTTPFKVAENFNPAMIEGLAMAVENDYDGLPVHYAAKLAYQAGYKFPIEKLFSGLNFFTRPSSISYIYAGSFIKYLADSYGVEIVKKLYSDSDFNKHFEKSLSALAQEYENFLHNYQNKFNKHKAQLYFGGVTIFKKFCPRTAASDVKKAWRYFNEKQFTEAHNLFKKVYGYSNSYQSLIGIIASLRKEKKYLEEEQFLSKQIHNFRLSQYIYNIELLRGDLLIKINKQTEAAAIYDSLLVQNPHIELTNEVLIRKTILKEDIDSLKLYFDKNEIQKYQKLLNMNKNEIKYFSIPLLLRLAKVNKQSIDELINRLKEKFTATDFISCYAAINISRAALYNFDYETAQYFAVQALYLEQSEDNSHSSVENLRLVNWFKNSAPETKSTFRFKQ